MPALARLLERLRTGCSARELAAAVRTSPELATRVLRLANSAAYAPLRPITALDRAIAYIGDATLRRIVLVTALVARASATADRTVGLAVARCQADAVRAAVVARYLAIRTGGWDPGEAFTLGLLAELGQVELLGHGGAPYARLVLEAPDPDATAADEIALVGTTHGAVGRALAEAWDLPPSVARVMADHHGRVEPGPADPASDDPVLLIRAAAWLVRDGLTPSAAAPELTTARTEAALAALGLEGAAERRETEALRPVVAEILSIFDVSADPGSGRTRA